jgi:hypothetical protein
VDGLFPLERPFSQMGVISVGIEHPLDMTVSGLHDPDPRHHRVSAAARLRYLARPASASSYEQSDDRRINRSQDCEPEEEARSFGHGVTLSQTHSYVGRRQACAASRRAK